MHASHARYKGLKGKNNGGVAVLQVYIEAEVHQDTPTEKFPGDIHTCGPQVANRLTPPKNVTLNTFKTLFRTN